MLALGIVREPTVWVFITSKYPGIHDIGLASVSLAETLVQNGTGGGMCLMRGWVYVRYLEEVKQGKVYRNTHNNGIIADRGGGEVIYVTEGSLRASAAHRPAQVPPSCALPCLCGVPRTHARCDPVGMCPGTGIARIVS